MKSEECSFFPQTLLVWPVKRVNVSPPEHGMFSINEARFFIPRRLSNSFLCWEMFFIKQMFRGEQISKVTGFCFSSFACTVGN